jgi:hypothetical protein
MMKQPTRTWWITVAVLSVSLPASASDARGKHTLEGPVQVAWEAIHDGSGSVQAKAIGVSPQNQTVFVTGTVETEGPERGGLTIAYSMHTGETIWSVLRNDVRFDELAVNPRGDVVIVSGTETVAYEAATGNELWQLAEPARDLVISSDGSRTYLALADGCVVSLRTATGAEDWRSRIDCYSNSHFWEYWEQVSWDPWVRFDGCGVAEQAIDSLPDGSGVAIAGMAYYRFSRDSDIWPIDRWTHGSEFVAPLDALTGSPTWSPWHDRSWGRRLRGYRIVASEHALLTSTHRDSGGEPYYGMVESFASGQRVWSNWHWGGNDDLGLTSDASVVVTTGRNDDYEWDTSAFQANTGTRLWRVRHDAIHDARTRALALADGDRAVFVTGMEGSPWTTSRIYTASIATGNGEVLWKARCAAGDESRDRGRDVATTGFHVFVTGESARDDAIPRLVTIAYLLVLPIEIDISPRREPNQLALGAPGVVSVALLGDEDFDVTTIDPESLRFGPDQAEPCGFMPVRDLDPDAEYAYLLPDVNGDGYGDLIVQFDVQQSGIQCGDTEATLTGELQTGRPFEGADQIVTVGCE